MASRKNEVDLVVRATDESSKVISVVKKAFVDFLGVQKDLVTEGKGLNQSFGDTAKRVADLAKQATGLKALETIASNATQAAAALNTIGDAVKRQESDVVNLGKLYTDASRSVERLKEQVDAEKAVLVDTRAARDAERQSLKAYGDQIKTVNNALKDLRERTRGSSTNGAAQAAIESASTGNPASALIAQRKALEDAQAKSRAAIETYNVAIKDQQTSIKALAPLVAAASANESKLGSQLDRSANALERENAAFKAASAQHAELAAITAQASQLSGVEAANQQKVADAYARTTAEMARAKEAVAAYNKTSSGFVAPTNAGASSTTRSATGQITSIDTDRRQAIAQLRDLQTQLSGAQTEAQKFSKALAQTDSPTVEMGAAAGAAQGKVRALKEELAQVQAALRSNQSSFSQWSQSVNSTATPLRQVVGALAPIAPAAQQAAAGGEKLSQSLENSANSSRSALSLFQRIRGEVLSLTASYIGLQAAIGQIAGVVNAFQSLEGAQSRLGAVFNQDNARVNQELDFLQQNADRLGISFQTLSDQYSKFAVAAKSANFQSQATRDIFISVAEAGRVNKLSVDQLNGVFLALEQMISKGKVSSEELRRQLGDRLPGAFSTFAAALGVSTAQLDKLMSTGKVIADQDTLLKFADELNKRFGPQLADSLKTTTTELGRFTNNIFESQLRVGNGGFMEAFTSGLKSLNEAFESKAGHEFFLSLGSAIGKVADGVIYLTQYSQQLLGVLAAIAISKVNGMLTGFIGSLKNSVIATAEANAGLFTWQGNVTALQAKIAGFRAALAPTNSIIAAFRAQLAAAAVASQLAGGRFVAMQATLAGLRAVAGVTAGVFRALWTAIGGLPGIILTGVTIALGQWLTQVDDTTAALDEHRRLMGQVQEAYDKVKGTTRQWKEEIKGISLVELEKNFRTLQEVASKSLSKLNLAVSTPQGGMGIFDSPELQALNNLVGKYASGKIEVQDFKSQLDELNKTLTEDSVKVAAAGFIDLATAALESKTNLASAAAAAKEYGSNSAEIKKVVAETGATVANLNDAQKDGIDIDKKLSDEGQKLTGILGDMQKVVAKVGDEFKRLETLNGLQKQFEDAKKLVHSVQELLELQGKYNSLTDQAIQNSIGSNSSIVDRIIGAEGNDASKNKDSTAEGLGQFIQSTWLRMFKQYFPDRAAGMSDQMILELRKDADLNRNMIALYVQENAKILQKAGLAVTDANLYLSHFLGAGDAQKVLKAAPGTPLQGLISDRSIAANQSVLGGGKTVDDAIAFATKRVGVSKEEASVEADIQKIEDKRAEKAKNYNDDLDNRLSLQAQEIDNAGKLTQEAYVQKALDAEMKKAREAGVTLSDDQVNLIKQQAAAEWENKQAKVASTDAQKQANDALQLAVALAGQRNALEKRLKDAEASGNTSLVDTLQTQLDDVNSKLQSAISNATSMWTAIGGDRADAAIAKLNTLKIKVDSSNKSYGLFGLKAKDVQSLVSSGVDGFVGIFDSFAQAVANGQNAFKALGTAFLQFAANFLREIATMILKQMLFNLLAGFGGPIGSAAKAAGGIATAHTGGVVGSNSVGMSNPTRSVSPSIFATAMRYHSGGVAGLAPDEVPTILKRGEEVITDNDPRHRSNGGMAPAGGAAQAPVALRNVITLDPKFAADMVHSASGEQAVLSVLKKNKATLRNLVG